MFFLDIEWIIESFRVSDEEFRFALVKSKRNQPPHNNSNHTFSL